ncbi:MAG: hypothetical protein JO015_02475 [Verrucomicrobia bacterium]|nr:hypothetical protein [Verrucomicrobiota bacterium]
MTKPVLSPGQLCWPHRRYRQLRAEVARSGGLVQGSLRREDARAWCLPRNVRGKTAILFLSAA